MLSRRFQFLLLFLAVLTIFYPAVFAELSHMDDVDLVTTLLNMKEWSLRGIFLPGSGGGLYYRPILYSTFVFDGLVWGAGSTFMHLENILLHLCNVLLVFLISEQAVPADARKSSLLPLISSLCFAFHPLVTEPVNWVSGRTDLLAGTFVLGSALFILKYKEKPCKRYLAFAATAFLMGMLTKEVALLFLPGALFVLVAKEITQEEDRFFEFVHKHRKKLCWFTVLGLVALGTFFLMRTGAFSSDSSRIATTLKFMGNDPVHSVFVMMRAFGFYVKKLFLPFPLNFAIVEVDPLYELLAIVLVPALVFIVWKRTLPSALFMCGLFLITPSFPIAFNQIAWTPYAERYLYISSAFVVIAVVAYLGRNLKEPNQRLVTALVVGIIVFFAGATFQRNLTWRTNIALFSDTVTKSPTFTKVWNELGVAYFEKHDYPNAERSFRQASLLFEMNVDEKSDLNLAAVLMQQKKIREAEQVYVDIMKKGGARSEKIVNQYVGFLKDRIAEEKNEQKKTELRSIIQKTYADLYAATKDPIALFNLGCIKSELGNIRGARSAYLTAYEMLDPKDRYRAMISGQLAAMEKK